MVDYSGHHTELARAIRALLDVFARSFTADQLAEVSEYLEHREYGLALATIASVVVDDRIPIRPKTVREVDHLAASMHMREACHAQAARLRWPILRPRPGGLRSSSERNAAPPRGRAQQSGLVALLRLTVQIP